MPTQPNTDFLDMFAFDPKTDMDKLPEGFAEHVVESVQNGAKNAAEVLGFSDEQLNTLDQLAHGYYVARVYGHAARICGFVLEMSPRRPYTWRLLGAVCQALKQYQVATTCYGLASGYDPNDVVSRVYCGECLCLQGNKEDGLKALKFVVDKWGKGKAFAPHITRAKAIIAADGGVPPTVVLRRKGLDIAEEARKKLEAAIDPALRQTVADSAAIDYGPVEYDENREMTFDDMRKNPQLMRDIQHLKQAVMGGRLTLAQVGGFTDNEMDGAYAVACKYAETGDTLHAIQIAGYLVFLNPRDARFYQLLGICLQRMQMWDGADYFYSMATSLDRADPMNVIYRGEARIMAGHVDDGVDMLQQGLALAKNEPGGNKDLINRANVLIRQFATD